MLGQLKHEEIEEFLRSSVVGRVGCQVDGRTYVVPLTYVYEDGAVFGRSANGLKLRMMRENPNVCFEVDRVEDLANWRRSQRCLPGCYHLPRPAKQVSRPRTLRINIVRRFKRCKPLSSAFA
jgi:Pyridoxamine 5'-phosphate oxidase